MKPEEFDQLTYEMKPSERVVRVNVVNMPHKEKSNKQIQDEYSLLAQSVRVARFAAICAALAAIGSVVSAVLALLQIREKESNSKPQTPIRIEETIQAESTE